MLDTKRILSQMRRAVDDYGMIEQGDRICIGLSAGKDSLTLLCAMAQLVLFYPKRFTICAVTLDMGYGADYSAVESLCEDEGVEYHIIPSNVARIVFEHKKEKNPCSLCSNLRRGTLNSEALRLGCNKVALGHHLDDAVETFYMNLLNNSRLECFSPVTHLDRSGITVIRPMLYAEEREIRSFARKNSLPVISSCCPANGNTERERVKQLVRELSRDYRHIRTSTFKAMQSHGLSGFGRPGQQLSEEDAKQDEKQDSRQSQQS